MSVSIKTYPKHKKATDWHHKAFVIDKVAIRRSCCRESYFKFCKTFWHVIVPENPVWNWHIRIMAEAVQKILEPVFLFQPKEYDLIINVPPGSTKSTICSIMAQPWCWTRMPSLRFLGGSFDANLSLDFGNKARRLVKDDLYRETFPDIEIAADQDTKGYFSNTRGGERRATSTGASIIGRHAHVHVVDDPIDPRGVRSLTEITTANNWMTETLPSRCVDQKITPLILVMQRLSQEDPTGTRLASKRKVPVKHICLPAEVSDNVKPEIFKNKYKEGLLDPIRLPRNILEIKREELGSFGYAGQFDQNPVPLTGGMFNTEKLLVLPVPAMGFFDRVMRWWDKAATQGAGKYTAGVLMGILKSKTQPPRYWILDVVRGRWDTSVRESMIVQTAHADEAIWGTKYYIGLEQEPGSSGKDSASWTIANLAGFRVVAERATGEKEERAVPFADQVNGGNVAMVKGAWIREYINELHHFGEGAKYSDQVDASSGAFNKLYKKKVVLGVAGF